MTRIRLEVLRIWLRLGIPRFANRFARFRLARRGSSGKITKSALIFSRTFWEQEQWTEIGSGRMQREAFACLSELGLSPAFAGQEDYQFSKLITDVDLIVSLATGVVKLPLNSRAITLLYTCNTHVSTKRARLRKTAKRWNLPCEEWPDELIIKNAYAMADYLLIAENEQGIQNFIENGVPKEKILEYNNAVDTNKWAPPPNKRETFTFVCWTSALGLRKGLPALVEGWRRWHSGECAELHLVGMPTITAQRFFRKTSDVIEGELAPGLHVDLRHRGPLDRQHVDRIGSCHVAMYPTLEDAQPSCLLEAASCGLAIATTKESGVRFPSDFCHYVEMDDPDSIASAFEYWYARRDVVAAAGLKSREYILANHTWELFRRRFNEILTQVISGAEKDRGP